MSRTRFTMLSAVLVGAASFIGLAVAAPVYQCWIADIWLPFHWGSAVATSNYCLTFTDTPLRLWLPLLMLPVATLLPIIPALARLRALNRSRAWAWLACLPALNPLLFTWLALHPGPLPRSPQSFRALSLTLLATLGAAFLYYYLLIYFPWLAAKS